MLKGREIGATFAPDEIGWIDFEARGRVPIKDGTYAYATNADAIILAYAIGDGPANIINSRRPGDALDLVDLPLDFIKHHAKVMNGTAVWAAWNCSFDRAIWNYATLDFPALEPHHIIDVMAQAVASGLPPDLKMAAKTCGASDKLESGRDLIALFCLPDSTATPQSHFEEWVDFPLCPVRHRGDARRVQAYPAIELCRMAGMLGDGSDQWARRGGRFGHD